MINTNLEILSILLEYRFISDPMEAVESIRMLLRFLLKKYSSCFYLLMMRTVKVFFKLYL